MQKTEGNTRIRDSLEVVGMPFGLETSAVGEDGAMAKHIRGRTPVTAHEIVSVSVIHPLSS